MTLFRQIGNSIAVMFKWRQAITEFTIPTANSGPNGITAGPDGALWFTEAAANKIGRITTAGLSDRLLHVELERVFERNVIRHEYRSKRG
jgi:streptogramin lyase